MIWTPDKYHIELTNACVAQCPFCARTMNKGVPTHQELSIWDIKKFFTVKVMSKTKYVTICGIYGDPIYAKDFLEIASYFNEHKLHVAVSTNGYNQKKDFWEALWKMKYVRITFGIDGITQKTHGAYRKGTQLLQVLKNAKKFTSTWWHATWQFIVFRTNEHQIERAREISKQLWFIDFVIRESRDYNAELLKPKMIFAKQGEKIGDTPDYIECEYKQKRQWYIASSGQVLPCCYLVNNEYYHEGLKDISMNIKHHSIKEIVKSSIWENDIGHFKNDGGENVCIKKCGKKWKTQRYSFENNNHF